MAIQANKCVGKHMALQRVLIGRLLGVGLPLLLGACTMETAALKRVPNAQIEKSGVTGPLSSKKTYRSWERRSNREQDNLDKESSMNDVVLINRNEKIVSLDLNLTTFRESLFGLDVTNIMELLGTPAFQRLDPPASIWQYRVSDCVVDVFFYDNKGQLIVKHVETRARDGRKLDEKVCFVSVLQKQQVSAKEGH